MCIPRKPSLSMKSKLIYSAVGQLLTSKVHIHMFSIIVLNQCQMHVHQGLSQRSSKMVLERISRVSGYSFVKYYIVNIERFNLNLLLWVGQGCEWCLPRQTSRYGNNTVWSLMYHNFGLCSISLVTTQVTS